jgi:hypothetical protein
VLRAMLWRFSGDLHRATRWASIIGQAFAWLFIAAGVGMILGLHVPLLGSGLVNGVWLAFIGWFLNNSALVSYRQLMTREALDGVTVSRRPSCKMDAWPVSCVGRIFCAGSVFTPLRPRKERSIRHPIPHDTSPISGGSEQVFSAARGRRSPADRHSSLCQPRPRASVPRPCTSHSRERCVR